MNLFPEEFGNLETKICFKTAYNYLHSNRVEPINKKYLFYYKNKKIKQPRPAKRINGLSIDERPKNVNERKEFGHHELDTMKSVRGDDTCLLNIVERVSRFTRLRKMESCDARHTILTIDKLERKKQIVTGGTCTTDNGPEVSDVNGLEKSVVSGKRMEMYYAKPYHA
jgi:IS30 family transposase